jgi:hypothetical protein
MDPALLSRRLLSLLRFCLHLLLGHGRLVDG